MLVKSFLAWMENAPVRERAEAVTMLAQAYLAGALGGDSPEAVQAALSGLIDPNTQKDYVSTRSAKNIKIDGDKVSLDIELGYPAKTQFEKIRSEVSAAIKAVPGVTNVGTRPTVNNGSDLSIEVNILDFSENIYRKQMRIEFIAFIRSEQRFDSLEQLTVQLKADREQVRKLLQMPVR